jgi:hypothetical protein
MIRNLKLIGIIGATYGVIEVVFTAFQALLFTGNWGLAGTSSVWMMIVGGFSGWLIGALNESGSPLEKVPAIWTWILFSVIVTALEFVSGSLLTAAGYRLWDYSNLPLNINGQVCLLFSIFWVALAPVAIRYDDILRSIEIRKKTGQLYSVAFHYPVSAYYKGAFKSFR